MKFDGYRAQIATSGSEVHVYTRNGHDWTQQFKVILEPLKTLTTGSVLLGGEIVAVDKAGRTNFSMLKSGIAVGIPLKFYTFDIFEKDGEDLTGRPLSGRKAVLEALIGDRDPGDSLQYSHHVVDNGKQSLTPTAIRDSGYGCIWQGHTSWNGVAILAKGTDPIETRRGLPGNEADDQSRYIEAAVNGVLIGGLYMPNGNPVDSCHPGRNSIPHIMRIGFPICACFRQFWGGKRNVWFAAD